MVSRYLLVVAGIFVFLVLRSIEPLPNFPGQDARKAATQIIVAVYKAKQEAARTGQGQFLRFEKEGESIVLRFYQSVKDKGPEYEFTLIGPPADIPPVVFRPSIHMEKAPEWILVYADGTGWTRPHKQNVSSEEFNRAESGGQGLVGDIVLSDAESVAALDFDLSTAKIRRWAFRNLTRP